MQATPVTALTDINQNKCYTVTCDRSSWAVANDGTSLTTIGKLNLAFSASDVKQQFAFVAYNNEYYLWSVNAQKFITSSNTLTNVASEAEPVYFADASSYKANTVRVYYNDNSNINVGGSNQITIDTWKTADAGCSYTIEEADDFDPSIALNVLNPSCSVCYQVSDASGVVYTSPFTPATVGDEISSFPSEFERVYCTYTVTPTTIQSGENTVPVTVTYNMPFAEGKWYYLALRAHYVYYNSDANDVRTNNQTTYEQAPAYQWGFTGNPYIGIKVQNRQTETYLTNTSNKVQLTADGYAWTIDALNATTFGLKSGTQYINEQNHTNHNLIYYTLFTNDTGSQFTVQEVPDNIINVTYQVVLDGQTLLTGVKSHHVGDATSLPENFARDFTTYTLDVSEITSSTTTVTATPSFSGLPFETSSDYENATWYYLFGHTTYAGSGVYTNGDAIGWQQGVKEATDAYKWAFIGNPVQGFKVINKAAGSGKYIQGSNPVAMGTTEKAWILKNQTETSYQRDGKGFGLWDASLTYVNVRSGVGNLQYWGSFDTGSTFWVEEVPVGEALFNQLIAQLEAYPYGTGLSQYSLHVEGQDYTSQATTIISGLKTQGYSAENLATAQALVDGTALNLPSAGFYRIKGNTSGKYLASGMASNDKFAMSSATDATTVFYFDGTKLTNLGSGMCNGMNGDAWAWVTGDAASTVTFLDGLTNGGYAVRSANACFYDNGTGNPSSPDRGKNVVISSSTNVRYTSWYLEEVTSLPISISAAGYATLYAPVALTIPTGVTAYAVADGDTQVEMTAIEGGVIPAETGVILKGEEGNYTFDITTTDASVSSDLTGVVAAATRPDGSYILSGGTHGVGFYKDGPTTVAGFKAYLPASASGSNVKAFSFGTPTGISELLNEGMEGATVIYDLSGRRVNNPTRGLYIVNGKKAVIK